MVYIVTYSLPDLSYCETQLGRRPHDILLICHAKFTHKAMTLQERFPDIHVRVHLEVHGKLLLIAPDTVYLGSTNFGDSGWEEFTVGIRSVEAVQFYEQSFGVLWAQSVVPVDNNHGDDQAKQRERAIRTFARKKYGEYALEDYPYNVI
jgi:PLD-like domain